MNGNSTHIDIVVLGAAESGVGAAVLAHKKGLSVFVSDNGNIKEEYKRLLDHHGIKEMVSKYKLPIEIMAHPIIREADGLAMSSRNVRLSPENRQKALVIYKALSAGRENLRSILDNEPAWKTDYATVINPENFKEESSAKQRAIVAGWIGGIRLIDNMEY